MAQYDSIAKVYDNLVGEKGDAPRRHIIDPLMFSLLPSNKNLTVLDAGCGNGYWTKLLSDRYTSVIGIDNSEKLLEIARNKNISANIEYKLMDLEQALPFSDESFDLVFSNMVVHYIQNINLFSKEMFRILKKDGLLLICLTHPIYESSKKPFLKSFQTRTLYKSLTLGDLAEVKLWYEPLNSVINHFKDVGFVLIQQKDGIITKESAQEYPKYKEYIGLPRVEALLLRK